MVDELDHCDTMVLNWEEFRDRLTTLPTPEERVAYARGKGLNFTAKELEFWVLTRPLGQTADGETDDGDPFSPRARR
jgi:hypothetical protein